MSEEGQKPLYDTRALRMPEWETDKDTLISDGWEWLIPDPKAGVVYIRKHMSGPLNTGELVINGERIIAKGWLSA